MDEMLGRIYWTNKKEMKEESSGLIIGISIGVVIGVVLAVVSFFCFRYHRKRSQIVNSSSRRATTIPIHANGADSCTIMSDSSLGTESPRSSTQNGMSLWLGRIKKASVVSASGILEYSYKYVWLFLVSLLQENTTLWELHLSPLVSKVICCN